MVCIVCGERATRYLCAQPACAHCVGLARGDEESRSARAMSRDRDVARAALAEMYPSLAKKMGAVL